MAKVAFQSNKKSANRSKQPSPPWSCLKCRSKNFNPMDLGCGNCELNDRVLKTIKFKSSNPDDVKFFYGYIPLNNMLIRLTAVNGHHPIDTSIVTNVSGEISISGMSPQEAISFFMEVKLPMKELAPYLEYEQIWLLILRTSLDDVEVKDYVVTNEPPTVIEKPHEIKFGHILTFLVDTAFYMRAFMSGGKNQTRSASKLIIDNLQVIKVDEKLTGMEKIPGALVTEQSPGTLVTEVKEKTCGICQEDLNSNATCLPCACKNQFHIKCIKPWIAIKNTCPMCRYELDTDDASYNLEMSSRRNKGSANKQ